MPEEQKEQMWLQYSKWGKEHMEFSLEKKMGQGQVCRRKLCSVLVCDILDTCTICSNLKKVVEYMTPKLRIWSSNVGLGIIYLKSYVWMKLSRKCTQIEKDLALGCVSVNQRRRSSQGDRWTSRKVFCRRSQEKYLINAEVVSCIPCY